jgi:hypothetical protein
MAKGEYIVEVREAGTDPADPSVWRPSLGVDPLPDAGDMATEAAAEKMRQLVTKWNREAGWYQFRMRYVPADEGVSMCTGDADNG